MRIGDRGHCQTARPVSPAPDDVRPRARAAASRRPPRAGLATAGRARPPAGDGRGRARVAALLPRTRRRHDGVLAALPPRPAARRLDPTPARAAAAAPTDRRGRAAAGDLWPADRSEARVRDRACDPAGDRRPRAEARVDRGALARRVAEARAGDTSSLDTHSRLPLARPRGPARTPDRSGRGSAAARARARARGRSA